MPRAKAVTAESTPRRRKTQATVGEARARGFDTSNTKTKALISVDKPLTDQQRLFVKFWAQGESPLSASLKAGYADGGAYAYRMVYQPNILALYRQEKEAYERDSGMNRKKVVDGFLEAIEMAKTMAEPSTMVAGWREVGKMCGYYEPVEIKHTINHQGKVLHERLEKLTDAELFELIQKRAEAMATPALGAPEGTHDGDADDAGSDAGDQAS